MVSGTRNILLIDDDKDDAEIFSAALHALQIDAQLAHFSDGKTGLEKLHKKETPVPDIIFLDINMPHINGWECLKELKRIAYVQNIPIVMYSTSSFEKQAIRAEDVGASAFFTKPSRFGELKEKLSTLFSTLLPA